MTQIYHMFIKIVIKYLYVLREYPYDCFLFKKKIGGYLLSVNHFVKSICYFRLKREISRYIRVVSVCQMRQES